MLDISHYTGGPLLALDGELPSYASLRDLIAAHSPIVAADGAALQLRKEGIRPDIIVGDLDTIGDAVSDSFFAETRIVRDESRDEYDGGKALRTIIADGHDRVTVIGAGGGMIDHVLNNFSLLAHVADRLRIRIVDDRCVGYIVAGDALTVPTREDERVSLIPLPTARLGTTGLFWEMDGHLLSIGHAEGASNRAVGDQVVVRVDEGRVALFHYPA